MANVENDEQDEEKIEIMSEQQFLELRQAFLLVDHNNDGLVRVKDLSNLFLRLDIDCQPFVIRNDELKVLLERTNIQESDQITFTQFLTLIACKANVNDTLEELQEAFCIFDPTNSGFITIKDILRVMPKIGENISEAEAEEMLRHADRDLDGKISFAEFIELLRCT